MSLISWTRVGTALLSCLLFLTAIGCERGGTHINTDGTDVKVDRNGAKVDVKRPGDKRSVDVEVKSGDGVDVNIDRDSIRNRIEERREEGQSDK